MSVTIRLVSLILLFTCTLPVRGYDVLVSVTGNLIANTCVVAAESLEKNVPLGDIGTRQLNKPGAVSNIKSPFTLTLEECGPTFTGVKIRFSGTPDDIDPRLIKVADGGATGVAVQILDKEGALIPLDTQTRAYGEAGDDRVQMNFYARLAATGAAIHPGDVSAIATWTTEYQ